MKKYFKHKINNLLVVNGIVTVHLFEFAKDFSHEGESHDFWEIVYAVKENVICSRDGQDILLQEGQMLFHKPNSWHTLASNGKTAPTVFIISFDCRSEGMRFFEDKVVDVDAQTAKFLFAIIDEAKKTFDIPFSNPYAKKLELHPTPPLGGIQMIKNYLEICLVSLMRELSSAQVKNEVFLFDQNFGEKLVNDTIKIINDNVHDRIFIDDICKKTSYSKSYLFKRFKQTTGKTVMEYALDVKIQKAKQLIRENELSVKQISEKLAFDTPNYFSKTFKKKTGLTPLQYKKGVKI